MNPRFVISNLPDSSRSYTESLRKSFQGMPFLSKPSNFHDFFIVKLSLRVFRALSVSLFDLGELLRDTAFWIVALTYLHKVRIKAIERGVK